MKSLDHSFRLIKFYFSVAQMDLFRVHAATQLRIISNTLNLLATMHLNWMEIIFCLLTHHLQRRTESFIFSIYDWLY